MANACPSWPRVTRAGLLLLVGLAGAAGWAEGYGLVVVLDHGRGYQTLYCRT